MGKSGIPRTPRIDHAEDAVYDDDNPDRLLAEAIRRGYLI
jgi:hypothetical protein